MLRLALLGLAAGVSLLLAGPALAQENDDCLDCHEGVEEGEVDPDLFAASVHGAEDCVGCHVDATEEHDEEEEPLEPAECEDCHEDEVDAYSTGIHGTLFAEDDPDAPGCSFCHGTHGILPQTDPNSPSFPLKVPELCAQCHREGERSALRNHASQTQILAHYTMSIHGKGLLESGLVVSATCTSCHTPHMELPADDPRSSVHRDNITDTCASCHFGIRDKLRTSIHSSETNGTDEKLPTCNDCHTSHTITRVTQDSFRLAILDQCGNCHEDVKETYFETHHGKVSKLGGRLTAKCYDCHGSHEIQPASDERSTLHASNIVETCRSCHPGSNANFVEYLPHATHEDREKYPELFYTYWAMTALLVGTMAFFGIHTLLWMWAALRDRFLAWRRRGAEEGEEVEEAGPPAEKAYLRRFRTSHSVLHLMVIVSFLSLAFTGMSLKFADNAFFAGATRLMGGPAVMGYVHHLGAIITFTYFGIHFYQLAGKFRRREITVRGLLTSDYSLVPQLQDLRDLGQHIRWFVGSGPRPKFGRWTYWEKFDYLAVFWGVTVIGLTGLAMWFPEVATLVLPGWLINVATVIHSDEALLAAAFIFTIHFFNTHVRPGKFPMDTVIFTGRMELEEFRAEHPREYEALVESGELEQHRVGPPPRWLSVSAGIFGTLFLASGIAIISAIVYSLVAL
jgi:cytochrome b subunit of formate dehydrogenase